MCHSRRDDDPAQALLRTETVRPKVLAVTVPAVCAWPPTHFEASNRPDRDGSRSNTAVATHPTLG